MAAHRYWRIWMTACAGASYAFSEIQFRVSAGVSLAFTVGAATAAQTFSGQPGPFDASHAADGNTATLYSSIDKTGSQWWAYDFGATSGNWRDVAEIALTARTDSNANCAPSNFVPQWSDDGTTWTSMVVVVTAAWTTLGQVQSLAVLPTSATYVAWNPADMGAGLSLTNTNLTVTSNGAAVSGIRATVSQTTGRYYWEDTLNARATTTGFAAGVMSGTVPLDSTGWPSVGGVVGSCGVGFNGNIYVDGNVPGPAVPGPIAVGAVVCIAVDAAAHLIWFRVGAAGQWNGSGTPNPATGTGGVAIATLGGAVPLFPATWLLNSADQITANFGAAAFTGVVPAGFTSGFTIAAGGGAATAQACAMVLA